MTQNKFFHLSIVLCLTSLAFAGCNKLRAVDPSKNASKSSSTADNEEPNVPAGQSTTSTSTTTSTTRAPGTPTSSTTTTTMASAEPVTREKCVKELLDVYKAGFYPFFRNNCALCHITGGVGKGPHADSNPDISFRTFNLTGVDLLSAYAVNNAHNPPYTGAKHVPTVNGLKSGWTTANQKYNTCVASIPTTPTTTTTSTSSTTTTTLPGATPTPPPPPEPPPIVPSDRVISINQLIPSAGGKITWDLSGGLSKGSTKLSFPGASFTINVATYTSVTGERGYTFTNPTLNAGQDGLRLYDLKFYINDSLAFTATTYTYVDVVVAAKQTKVLSPATLIVPMPVAAGDKISLFIGVLEK